MGFGFCSQTHAPLSKKFFQGIVAFYVHSKLGVGRAAVTVVPMMPGKA
jgi:hypothetical protein